MIIVQKKDGLQSISFGCQDNPPLTIVPCQLLSVLVSLRYSRRSAWSLSAGLVCLAWLGLALTVHSGQAEAALFSSQEIIKGDLETRPLGLQDYLPPLLVLVLRISFQVNNNK